MDVLAWFFLVFFMKSFKVSLTLDWSYSGSNGPQFWASKYPQCGKKGQSPRNVLYGETVYNNQLSALKFVNFDMSANFVLENKLHRIQARLKDAGSDYNFIPGGKLTATFVASEIHFHWGDETAEGSEHQINSKKFPAEAHIVHYDKKYKDFKTAALQTNGLAVVSVIFDVSLDDNPVLKNIIDNLPHVNFEGFSKGISLSLKGFLPKNTRDYFYYNGTLTTPPCTPSVNWFIFKERILISEKQLRSFRSVYDAPDSASQAYSKLMGDNFRPINQSLVSNTPISRSFEYITCDSQDVEGYTALCSTVVKNKSVNYALTLNRCVLPNSGTLQITIPDENFSITKTTFIDIHDEPLILGSLGYQVRMEFHAHNAGGHSGKIHFSVYQEKTLPPHEKKTILDTYFKVDPCSEAQCMKQSDKVYSCRHVVEDDVSKMNLTFQTEITGCYPLKVKLSVQDTQLKTVSSGTFVSDDTVLLALRSNPLPNDNKKLVLNTANFSMVSSKDNDNIQIQFFMISSLHYPLIPKTKVIDVSYTKSSVCPVAEAPRSNNKKITIGVAIVLIMLTMIGLAGVLFWRRYRNAYQEPGLVGEMEIDGDGDMNVSFR